MSGPGRRAANRIALALLGLAGLAIAAAAAWPLVTGGALPLSSTVAEGVARTGLPPAVAAWIVVAALTVLILLALLWALWPGRGRMPRAVETADGVAVDTGVVQDLARAALAGDPDVLAVHAVTFRRRRARWVRLTVQLRARVDAPGVVARVGDALAEVDAALGERLPIVVHLTTGVRTALAADRRVD